MDGDRARIYDQTATLYDYDSGLLVLNKTARETAQKYDIDFIDLHLIFSKVFLQNRKKFNFKADGHWNAWGHKIVANHIYQYLNKNR